MLQVYVGTWLSRQVVLVTVIVTAFFIAWERRFHFVWSRKMRKWANNTPRKCKREQDLRLWGSTGGYFNLALEEAERPSTSGMAAGSFHLAEMQDVAQLLQLHRAGFRQNNTKQRSAISE
jgi:hypothetical protein